MDIKEIFGGELITPARAVSKYLGILHGEMRVLDTHQNFEVRSFKLESNIPRKIYVSKEELTANDIMIRYFSESTAFSSHPEIEPLLRKSRWAVPPEILSADRVMLTEKIAWKQLPSTLLEATSAFLYSRKCYDKARLIEMLMDDSELLQMFGTEIYDLARLIETGANRPVFTRQSSVALRAGVYKDGDRKQVYLKNGLIVTPYKNREILIEAPLIRSRKKPVKKKVTVPVIGDLKDNFKIYWGDEGDYS